MAPSISSLRSRGEELLRRSADVGYSEETHPAYDRILSQLAPDEARILRLLALRGAQPAVDVRAGLPLVSSLVAPGRNMIGAEAGCRYVDRVPAYLNNLYRLGLIWFSREPLSDRLRYQVLEAQPDVLEGLKKKVDYLFLVHAFSWMILSRSLAERVASSGTTIGTTSRCAGGKTGTVVAHT